MCIPDTHDSFKFIINLFVTLTGIKLVEYTDKNRFNKSFVNQEVWGGVLDEFKAIGSIPRFLNWLATFRGRRINLMPVLQDVAQLVELFGDSYTTFLSNCDTKLILGVGQGDNKTAELVQNMLGKMPIKEMTKVKEYGATKMMQGKQVMLKDGEREMMTPDEIYQMDIDELLLFRRSQKPAKFYKMPISAYAKDYAWMQENRRNPFDFYNPFLTTEETEFWREEFEVNGITIPIYNNGITIENDTVSI